MVGYCTVDDVRRALQDREFSGALSEDAEEPVVEAIEGLTERIQKITHKHWYVPGGVSDDVKNVVSTAVETRDDEHDISTHGGYVVGNYGDNRYRATTTSGTVFASDQQASPQPKQQIRLDRGDLSDDTVPAYTRIQLERKDVETINSLKVANADGGYDDWVSSTDYTGGVGFDSHVGDDFYVRVNSGGVSELYINVHSLDDDIAHLSNAVVVDFDYGDSELPMGVRRGVALLAASELVVDDEFQAAIPDDGQLTNVETKAEQWERLGLEKLDHHLITDDAY